MEILATTMFEMSSTKHILNVFIPVQLLFGQDIILPIRHIVDCKLILQHNQYKVINNSIRKNARRIDYN